MSDDAMRASFTTIADELYSFGLRLKEEHEHVVAELRSANEHLLAENTKLHRQILCGTRLLKTPTTVSGPRATINSPLQIVAMQEDPPPEEPELDFHEHFAELDQQSVRINSKAREFAAQKSRTLGDLIFLSPQVTLF